MAACQTDNDGDPTALYDSIANRWLLSQFAVNTTPNLNCVAVSTSPDPTGTYNRYSYSYADFPDYPKFGIWPDAYYVTFNMFAGGYVGRWHDMRLRPGQDVDRRGGHPAVLQRRHELGRIAAVDRQRCDRATGGCGQLRAWVGYPHDLHETGVLEVPRRLDDSCQYDDDRSNVSHRCQLHEFLRLALARGDCIPAMGGTNLESLADRLMYRLNYRNLGGHEALVVNHTIEVGSGSSLHSGVRWYEIRPDASRNLTLFQQGTYSPDNNWRWMGSINMDQSGNIAMGYSVSGSTIKPQIHYTGRLVGDALGTMSQGENVIINGGGAQTSSMNGGPLARWGDYSSMAVDPVDDCTFFHANQYLKANGAFNWSTRIASFKLPNCPRPTSRSAPCQRAPAPYRVAAPTTPSALPSPRGRHFRWHSVRLDCPRGRQQPSTRSQLPAGSSSTMTVNVGPSTSPGNVHAHYSGHAVGRQHALNDGWAHGDRDSELGGQLQSECNTQQLGCKRDEDLFGDGDERRHPALANGRAKSCALGGPLRQRWRWRRQQHLVHRPALQPVG